MQLQRTGHSRYMRKRSTLMRRIMLQIILLMTTLSICPPNADESGRTADTETEPKKKRRRRERASSPAPPLRVEPGTQPAEALDLLCDRVAVWMIVAELDTGADSGSSGGDARKNGVAGVVHRFWKHVLHPQYVRHSHTAFYGRARGDKADV